MSVEVEVQVLLVIEGSARRHTGPGMRGKWQVDVDAIKLRVGDAELLADLKFENALMKWHREAIERALIDAAMEGETE